MVNCVRQRAAQPVQVNTLPYIGMICASPMGWEAPPRQPQNLVKVLAGRLLPACEQAAAHRAAHAREPLPMAASQVASETASAASETASASICTTSNDARNDLWAIRSLPIRSRSRSCTSLSRQAQASSASTSSSSCCSLLSLWITPCKTLAQPSSDAWSSSRGTRAGTRLTEAGQQPSGLQKGSSWRRITSNSSTSPAPRSCL